MKTRTGNLITLAQDSHFDVIIHGCGYTVDGYHSENERTLLVGRPTDARKAAYGVNGRWVDRRIRASDYTFSFVDGSRSVAVPDPLGESVSRFVAALRTVGEHGIREPGREVAARMAMLEGLLEAYQAGEAA